MRLRGTSDMSNDSGMSAKEIRQTQKRTLVIAILSVTALIFLLLLVLIGNLLISGFVGDGNGEDTSKDPIQDGGKLPEISFVKELISSSDKYKGELLLIDADNVYNFTADDMAMKQIYGYEGRDYFTEAGEQVRSYKISSSDLKLQPNALKALDDMLDSFFLATQNRDVQVISCHRTYDKQLENAQRYPDEVSAGYTEHHMGTAFDLNVLNSDGTYQLGTSAPYSWIYENCYKYGIIWRYQPGKTELAGEDAHFRYVGLAHAYYMNENNLSFEEYLAKLRSNHDSNEKGLRITDAGGNDHLVYYVKASSSEITEVKVPEGYNYTVSGDNMDGFIITVDLNSGSQN